MGLLSSRRESAESCLTALQERLPKANELVEGKACVYVTGSLGRGEASQYSDLDLFIADNGSPDRRALTRLDEILVKAELIEVTRTLDFPEFSGDGEYLQHYTVEELIETLGHPDDDASNTFTARLLLLLESEPLLETGIYWTIIEKVIEQYWRDFKDHETKFIPAFLANDILRLWRTFCVNYEARTQTEPPAKKAKRKLKNYKLKHSRLLTCYSGLAHLLAVFTEKGTVTQQDAKAMVALSPTARLERLEDQFPAARTHVARILSIYEEFLQNTDVPESTMVQRFQDPGHIRKCSETAGRLNGEMFDLIEGIGKKSQFHRLLLV